MEMSWGGSQTLGVINNHLSRLSRKTRLQLELHTNTDTHTQTKVRGYVSCVTHNTVNVQTQVFVHIHNLDM